MQASSVLIFCGSLDAGRDGVGDHTRLLRDGILQIGGKVQIASLFDTNTEIIEEDGLVRLPKSILTCQRTQWIRRMLAANSNPIVVIQLVPFSFHAQGILLKQAWTCGRLFDNNIVGIITHELWPDAVYVVRGLRRVKERLMKMSFLFFLRRIRPRWIGTSITLYRKALAAEGVETELLPLFGNINPHEQETRTASNLLGMIGERERQMRVVVFGSVYGDWFGGETIRVLREAARRLKRDMVVVLAGCGRAVDRLRGLLPENCRVIETGFLQPEEISAVFAMCDVGVSTTPAEAAGKSGAAVAMLEHGLPVVLERAAQNLKFEVAWPPVELRGLAGEPLIAGPEAVTAICDSVCVQSPKKTLWRRDAVVSALARSLNMEIG